MEKHTKRKLSPVGWGALGFGLACISAGVVCLLKAYHMPPTE